MKVLVTTPYENNSLQGNTVTAKRVVSILIEEGIDAAVLSIDDEVRFADVIIALHARKSAHFIDEFLAINPVGKVIIFLTGTDLYDDLPNDCDISERSIERADLLVVAQEASLASVPEKHRLKAVVVYQSIHFSEFKLDDEVYDPELGLFAVIGHLRAVKQPFMALEAMQLLDESVRLKLVLLGKEVDSGSGDLSRTWQAEDSRFQWLGVIEHQETLKWIKRSVATVNTSLAEGGANSVGESIMLGVPVLATRVEGNVGMLGDDYSGYFSADNRQELADLMDKVIHDGEFLEKLRKQVKARSKKFSRENEKRNWSNLIYKIT